MSVWDKLPVIRSWDGLEAKYPVWDSFGSRTWRELETGYVYTLPTIEAITPAICFVGEPYRLTVEVSERVEPEDGGESLPTEEPFTGTVAVSFQGKSAALAYDETAGAFVGNVDGPAERAWSESSYTFTGTVTAVNERGAVTAEYEVIAHKAFPSIVSVSAADSRINETFALTADIRIATIPEAGGGIPLFSGAATASFEGETYPLSHAEGNMWTATLPSPGSTSWNLENHVYAGALTATMGELSAAAPFGARVREITPPDIAQVLPIRDIFICNDVSPLWQWSVSDEESGVSHATVTINGGPVYETKLYAGVVSWQMPVLPAGEYTVAITVTDNDDNAATASRTVTGFPLIFDRTKADAARVRYLNSLIYVSENGAIVNLMTAEERAEWESDLKGAYNASDLNRVETAVEYLSARCIGHRVNVPVEAKIDWAQGEIPSAESLARYLDNASLIAGKFDLLRRMGGDYYHAFTEDPEALPESMSALTVEGANAIENGLVFINREIAWLECMECYAASYDFPTWGDVEAEYPQWENLEGNVWMNVEMPVIDESALIPPWTVYPLEE